MPPRFAYVASVLLVTGRFASAMSVTVESPANFIETYLGKTASVTLIVRNDGDNAVTVSDVESHNRLIEVKLSRADVVVPAHSSADISLQVTSRLALGVRLDPVDLKVLTSAGLSTSVRADVRVFVESAFDNDRPDIDLGVVRPSAVTAKSLALTSTEIPGIALSRILESPKFLDVKISDQGKSIIVTPTSNAPWGISQGYIRVGTNSDAQPEVAVHFQLDMRGDVIPSQNPLIFGPDNVGSSQEQTVRLDSTDGRPVRVRSVSVSGTALTNRVDECTPVEATCKLLRLILPADAPSGRITGIVTVAFVDRDNVLPIQIGGFRLGAGQMLKSLTENTETRTSVAFTPSTSVDVARVVAQAEKQRVAQPVVPGKGPLLKWSVTHEAAIFGYVIYRGDKEDGPFRRINNEIIPATKDEDATGDYQWRDTAAESGKTYWYYVGAVENSGRKHALSQPNKVVAK